MKYQIEYHDGCPVVWKKAGESDIFGYRKDVLVKLALLPESRVIIGDEASVNSFVIKCRADKAEVLGFYNLNGKRLPSNIKVVANSRPSFGYVVGKIVKPNQKFDLRPISCASGIHFFFSRNAAARYY